MLSFTVYPTPVSRILNPSKQTTKSFDGCSAIPSDGQSNSVLPSLGGAGGVVVKIISTT